MTHLPEPESTPAEPTSEAGSETPPLAWPDLPDLSQFDQYAGDVFWRVVRYAVSIGYTYAWINEASPEDGCYLMKGEVEVFVPLDALRVNGAQAARNLYLVLTTK